MTPALLFKDGKTIEDKRDSLDLKALSPEEQKIAEQIQKKYKAILASQYRREIAIQNGKESIEFQNPLRDNQDLEKANTIKEAKKHGWSIKTNGDLIKLESEKSINAKIDEKTLNSSLVNPKVTKSSTEAPTPEKQAEPIAKLAKEAVDLAFGRNGTAKDLIKAVTLANHIIKSDPNNIDALIVIARNNLNEERIQDCPKLIDRILKINPKHSDALQAKAELTYMLSTDKDSSTQSVKLSSEALEANPNNLQALLSIGIAYKLGKGVEKDLKKSLEYINRASALDPKSTDILLNLGDLNLKINESAEQGQKAFACFEQVEKIQPDSLLAKAGLAECYLLGIGTSKDLLKAKMKVDEALRINPEHEKSKKLQMQITEAMIKIISELRI